MDARCHVCGRNVRKPVDVPVCGDADTKIVVCSRRCRDEYLAGFVETRGGKTVRYLSPPRGPGSVLALVWLTFAAVRLLGPLLADAVTIPLLPARRGPLFLTAGIAAIIVALALLRQARSARALSVLLAAAGFAYAVIAWWRTGDPSWAVEAVAFHPAAVALSLGDPGPRRVILSLAVFGAYPAALVFTTLAVLSAGNSAVERVAAESYRDRWVTDETSHLRFVVPAGWYVLRPGSRLLPLDDSLFRALEPDDGLSAVVRSVEGCTPEDLAQVKRILDELGRGGVEVSVAGVPTGSAVDSAMGAGRGFFMETDKPDRRLWYVVLLPWARGRCIEIRCGGSVASQPAIRRTCVELGARSIEPAW